MAVLDMHPHLLAWEETKEGYYLENGDYVEGEGVLGGVLDCSAELNKHAETLEYPDGERKAYSYKITLKPNERVFTIGERVKLHLLDGSITEYRVLSYKRYQHFARLWV